jgi:putative MATE family efflux protein
MEEAERPAERAAALGRDWTKGSILGNLLTLSWPMMISGSLYMVGQTIDMIWVGRLGPASIAGVGVAGIAVLMALSAMLGLTTGARAVISRFVGAGEIAAANNAAGQAFVISLGYGLITTAIGVFLGERILGLFGLQPEVVAEGATYLRIAAISWTPMAFSLMAINVMQASGDAVPPMKVALVFRLSQVALCPFLVFGWWVFPQLGVMGVALSQVITETGGMSAGLWLLFSGRSRLRPSLRHFRFDWDIIWRMVKIGLPGLIMGVERNFGSMVLMWIIVPFGTVAVAAHSLIQRVEMVVTMPGWGLGMGASVLVGQNLGARQPERAQRSAWLATGIVEGFLLVCALAILLGAEHIIRVFSSDPALVEMGGTFLRIAAAGYAVMGFSTVLQNCISGSGDTVPTMIVSMATMWLVLLPLAWFLPRITDLGVNGVRWAIVTNIAAGAIAYTLYFRLGRWKRKRI